MIPVLPYTVVETLGLSATVVTLLLASFAMAMLSLTHFWGGDYIDSTRGRFSSAPVACIGINQRLFRLLRYRQR